MEHNKFHFIPYASQYAEQTVEMWRESKFQAIGQREIHSFDNHVHFLNHILPQDFQIELAMMDEQVAGIIAYNQSEISQLYIHVSYQGLGIGTQLLERAKERSKRLTLYTFEVNKNAQQFYERNGFQVIGRGNENEENLPDLLYEWKAL